MVMRFLVSVALLLVAGEAAADKTEAETCLRTKIWDGYNEGWAVRTAVTAELEEGAHRIYLVTLYAGNEYRFQVCGDPGVKDVDVILHDNQGKEVMRDTTDDREPTISYKPTVTDTYYVAVYAAKLERSSGPASEPAGAPGAATTAPAAADKTASPPAGISLAVTYR
jgi:hypothetical protein